MDICKEKEIHHFCQPNALMTLEEYLEDYASEETKKLGKELIKKELDKLTQFKSETAKNLEKIEQGERDLNF